MNLAKNKNFVYLISGRVMTNFGDSLYAIVVIYITISIYNLGASSLAIFGLITFFPSLINFAFGTLIDNYKNKKNLLIYLEIIQLIAIAGILVTVYFRLNVLLIFLFHFVFAFANTIFYPVQSSILRQILNYEKKAIEKSVYVMNVTFNTVDILSNFLTSIMLIYMSVVSLLVMDLFTLLLCIVLFVRISLKNNVRSTNNNPIVSQVKELNYKEGILFSFNYFWEKKLPSRIVVMEAIRDGFITIIMRIAGIYLMVINIGIEYLGILYAIQRGSELLGVFFSNHIRISFKKFFIINYLISGLSIIGIYLVNYIILKTALFSITFILMGVSGTVYGRMIYHFYDFQHIGKISSVINTVSSLSMISCLFILMVYENVEKLILITGIITLIFSLYLVFSKSKDRLDSV